MNINEKFIININGQSYVTYEGLLDLAHQKGLDSLTVDIIQFPSSENGMVAVCKATALSEGKIYSDIGDASPQSVQNILVPHILRMASTRAKARTLRDFTNVGMTAFEELDLVNNEFRDNKNNQKIEPATNKQLDTINKLSNQLGVTVEIKNLNKNSAGKLISEMIDKVNKK